MIDEKKLIEFIKSNDFKMRTIQSKDSLQDILIQFVEEQPKVGDWIQCSERFPDERGTYIVNAIESHMVHVTFAKWMPRMKKWDLTGSRSYWKVTAWQPLPEPYRPEKESE